MLDEMRVKGCFYCRLSLSSSPSAFSTLILSRLTQDILYPVLLCARPLLSGLLGWEGSQVLLEHKLETKVGKKLLSQTTLRNLKKKTKPNKLVPRRPKCCSVERASKPKPHKTHAGQSRYFMCMFLRSFSEIPIFYFFLFPEGIWQFQNINFEMSLSFKLTNLLKLNLSCHYIPLQTIGRSWWNNI